jgi:hypothetical protein
MEAIITQSVEKVALIPLTHVYQPTLENDGAWGIQSQRLPNVIYVISSLLTLIHIDFLIHQLSIFICDGATICSPIG